MKTTRTDIEKIRKLLAELRLGGMAAVLERELDRAQSKGCPAAEVIVRLLAEESAYRQEHSLANRLKHAKIPWDLTLTTFPFDQQPGAKTSDHGPGGAVLCAECRKHRIDRKPRNRKIGPGHRSPFPGGRIFAKRRCETAAARGTVLIACHRAVNPFGGSCAQIC